MSFFIKFITEITSKLKTKKANKLQNKIHICENSTTKRAVNSACTLTLSSNTIKMKESLDTKLELLIKKYRNNPKKLLQYIEMQGVNIYTLPNAGKLLSKINEEEGFIVPLKGKNALLLNLIIGLICENKIKLGLKTNAMMIFNTKNIDFYTLARAIYKFYGFKKGLPGYDYKSQAIFKKIYNSENSSVSVEKASFKDLCACKEALARDLDSIKFTVKLSTEYDSSKKALQKLKETNSINV